MPALTLSTPRGKTQLEMQGKWLFPRKGNCLKTHVAKGFFSSFGWQILILKKYTFLTFYKGESYGADTLLLGGRHLICSVNIFYAKCYIYLIASRTGNCARLGIILHFKNCLCSKKYTIFF